MENSKMGENAADNVEITFYTAECMEFVRYGEYREGLGTLEEALKYYDEIPPDRLNAVKGIGIHVYDPKENGFIQEFPLIMGKLWILICCGISMESAVIRRSLK